MAIKSCTPVMALLAFLKGEVRPDHVYKLALYTKDAELGPNTRAYTRKDEVVAAGYTSRQLGSPVFSADETGVTMGFTDELIWENVTISAAGCMIYNETLGGLAICIGDFGGIIASTNDRFKLILDPALIKLGV